MDPPMITGPPVPALAVLPGAAVLASVPPMAICGRSSAALRVPVPALAADRLTAIARRAAAGNDGPHPERMTAVVTAYATALAALPPRQPAALVLRYFDDLNEAEITDMPGCSAGTFKSQISRGLARRRGATGGQDEPGPDRTERRTIDERL